jgi:glycyl-tRNA synthetase beta chain
LREAKSGRLADKFILVANTEASDGGKAIVAGNERVIRARLAEDLAVADLVSGGRMELTLGIGYRPHEYEMFGVVKAERVARLAEWLVSERLIRADFEAVGRAARLAKADLVTEMVGEFPELQGVIGGYYAEAQGEPKAVAEAIRDHYKPVGQGDEVPTAPVTVAVSLADKLDNLFAFFRAGILPTGSKDPFALRRAGLAELRLCQENELRFLVTEAAREWAGGGGNVGPGTQVTDFLHDRLGVMLRDSGIRYDVVQASAWSADDAGSLTLDGDLVRVRLRAEELQRLLDSQGGGDLLTGYKRAANILKKEKWDANSAAEGDAPAEE